MQETVLCDNLLNYSEILEYFGEEKVQDRYRYLHGKLQEYITARGLENKLAINENVLDHAIMDYFTDVYRLKEFHKIGNINKAKIAAYEIYWILRRKPMQIIGSSMSQENQEEQQDLSFANEGFAVTFIANEFLMPKETVPMSEEKESKLFAFLDHLYYTFKYRNVDKQGLETILFAFDVGKQFA